MYGMSWDEIRRAAGLPDREKELLEKIHKRLDELEAAVAKAGAGPAK